MNNRFDYSSSLKRFGFAALAAILIFAAASGQAAAASYLRLDRDFSAAVDAGGVKTPFYGKKIAFIGDSYVQNHHKPIEETWHYLFAQKNKMHYCNFGRNGNRIVFSAPKYGTPIVKRYKEIPKDVDYIVVIAGHNDTGAIGAEADESKRGEKLAEFERAFKALIANLKKDYPAAKIAFITPWGVDRAYFEEVISVIKKASSEAGIACFDAAKNSGIYPNDPDFRKKYFQSATDTAHLNRAGHKFVLPKMEEFLTEAFK